MERAGGQRAQGGAAGTEPVQAPEAARHGRRRPCGHGGAAGRLQPVRGGPAKTQGLVRLCAQGATATCPGRFVDAQRSAREGSRCPDVPTYTSCLACFSAVLILRSAYP